ncbi:alpha/beta fold hydrolase [Aquabacter sp. CN5-332]|uniref:alpha/beta hydrolase n=1 Tax=Aquabacter sp. CN5-332 TaxID=3156608 RepID=UPI0032B5C8A8
MDQRDVASGPPIPEELRRLMAEIGPKWGSNVGGHVKLMLDHFTEVLKDAPTDGVSITRDVVYGSHPRQSFDVFQPAGAAGKRPALIFVHGGAFVEGHRNRTLAIYSNVLMYFARHGIVGVNVGYRLADDTPYPGATQDIAAVVAWVKAHATDLGIDEDRIFLMGHSAGCAHVATYAYDARFRPDEGNLLRGLILVSGRVRADVLAENPNAKKVEAYYQTTDAALLDDYSPVSHVDAGSVPTLVAWAEYENPLIDVYSAELVHRLAVAKRRSPPVVWLQGHNHTSIIGHFNTADERLGQAIRRFICEH